MPYPLLCTLALIERPKYLDKKLYVHVQPNHITIVINYLN